MTDREEGVSPDDFACDDGGVSAFASGLEHSYCDLVEGEGEMIPYRPRPPPFAPSSALQWEALWETAAPLIRAESPPLLASAPAPLAPPVSVGRKTKHPVPDDFYVPIPTVRKRYKYTPPESKFNDAAPLDLMSTKRQLKKGSARRSVTHPYCQIIPRTRIGSTNPASLEAGRAERSDKLRSHLRKLNGRSTPPSEMKPISRSPHEYDPNRPFYNCNCPNPQNFKILLSLFRTNQIKLRERAKQLKLREAAAETERIKRQQELCDIPSRALQTAHTPQHCSVPRYLEGDSHAPAPSVHRGNWSLVPIPLTSRASQFPPDWLVERRSNKTYYIRSPAGVSYTSIKEAMHTLEKMGKVLPLPAPTRMIRDPSTAKILKKRAKTKLVADSIDQSITPLSKMWMEDHSENLLGARPVWNDDWFVEENLAVFRAVVLGNRTDAVTAPETNNVPADSSDRGIDGFDNGVADAAQDAKIAKQLAVDMRQDNGLTNAYENLKDNEGVRTSGRARRVVNRMVHSDTGAALPPAQHAHALVVPKFYAPLSPLTCTTLPREDEPPPQPFEVIIHPDVPFLADLHAHCAKVEIIGLLGGRWIVTDNTFSKLYVQACFPCIAANDGTTDVEIDPVSMTTAQEALDKHGLQVVGWYHSHPTFDAKPSTTDLINQATFQTLFQDTEMYKHTGSIVEPFVGLIVRPPPSLSELSKMPSSSYHEEKKPFVSEQTWFHVHKETTTYSSRAHSLARQGYSGITLPDSEECAFAMKLRVKMRIRKESLADLFLKREIARMTEGGGSYRDLYKRICDRSESRVMSMDRGKVKMKKKIGKGYAKSKPRICPPAPRPMVVESIEKAVQRLQRQRRIGFKFDRGYRRAKEVTACYQIIISNDYDNGLLPIDRELRFIKSNYVSQLLENGQNCDSPNPDALMDLLTTRGQVGERKVTPQRLWCCELCGHTFDQDSTDDDSDNDTSNSESSSNSPRWKIFQSHLHQHQVKNHTPPPVSLIDNLPHKTFRSSHFRDSVRRIAASYTVNRTVCGRFRGVYPLPGSGSFMAVSTIDFTSSNPVKSLGVYDTEVEGALAYDSWIRGGGANAWQVLKLTLMFPQEGAVHFDTRMVNFRTDGERNPSSMGIPMHVNRLPRSRGSPYRSVSGDNSKWRCHSSRNGVSESIATFNMESEAARIHNILIMRREGGEGILNHIPLEVSQTAAEREGFNMDYMTKPLFDWDERDSNMTVDGFDFYQMKYTPQENPNGDEAGDVTNSNEVRSEVWDESSMDQQNRRNEMIVIVRHGIAIYPEDEHSDTPSQSDDEMEEDEMEENKMEEDEMEENKMEENKMEENKMEGDKMEGDEMEEIEEEEEEMVTSDIESTLSETSTEDEEDDISESTKTEVEEYITDTDLSTDENGFNNGQFQGATKSQDQMIPRSTPLTHLTEKVDPTNPINRIDHTPLNKIDDTPHKPMSESRETPNIPTETVKEAARNATVRRILNVAIFSLDYRLSNLKIPNTLSVLSRNIGEFSPKRQDDDADQPMVESQPECRVSVWCSACNVIVQRADSSFLPEGADEDTTTSSVVEKLERHIVTPLHCLLISTLPQRVTGSFNDSSSLDSHNHGHHFLDMILAKSSQESIKKTVCICRQPVPLTSGVISTGTLLHCRVGSTGCNGYFHPECCQGGYLGYCEETGSEDANLTCTNCAFSVMKQDASIKMRPRELTNTKPISNNGSDSENNAPQFIGGLSFPNEGKTCITGQNNGNTLPSLWGSAKSELKGLFSQIEAVAKYYSVWPEGRRAELCNKVMNGDKSQSLYIAANNNNDARISVDQCDRMRIALAVHVPKMFRSQPKNNSQGDDDDCVSFLDVACRYVRYCWTASLEKRVPKKIKKTNSNGLGDYSYDHRLLTRDKPQEDLSEKDESVVSSID